MNASSSCRLVPLSSVLAKARTTAPPALRAIQSFRPFAVSARTQQQQTTPIDPKPHRPVSPHLTIYQPQLTWYLSSAHRITGVALSGLFYLTFAAYAAAPFAGLGFSSADAVATFGALPLAAKVGTKFLLAYPFTFHSFNGVRHLMWDTAKGLSLKGVYTSGYLVMGTSTVAALGLAMM